MNYSYEKEKCFLVGIAASAGGLEPMQELLAHASCHGSMSFVVVSHLNRTRESELPKILERAANLKATVIEDGMAIENCRLYLIPPDRYVKLIDSKFCLEPRPEGVPNEVANVFFESLSHSYGENAIGVVLSGASVGADGSTGVRAIKAAGGHTYAQSPESAEFPDMPELAIETGCVDTVDTPERIGQELSLAAWAMRE